MSSDRNPHELYQGYIERGVKSVQTRGEALQLAKILMGEEAFADPKHRANKVVKADIRSLYEMAVPNQPDADVIMSGCDE